jgi:hypothetical protein
MRVGESTVYENLCRDGVLEKRDLEVLEMEDWYIGGGRFGNGLKAITTMVGEMC